MTDIERRLRDLGERVREEQSPSAMPPTAIRAAKRRRLATAFTGVITLAALVFGATFASGAFSAGETKVGPADDSRSTESSQTLYAIFDDERVDLMFETEIDAICNFGSHMFADEAVAKAEIIEGERARTSVIVFEPDPTDIDMTIDTEDDHRVGWCFEGIDRRAMDAVLESPERHFLVLTYRNGDEAISALRRDNGHGNYATGPNVTIAEGQFQGQHWEYYGYESNDGLCLELALADTSGGGCGFPGRSGRAVTIHTVGTGSGVATIDGEVSDEVGSLEIQIGDGSREPVELHEPPTELGLEDRVFVYLIDIDRLAGSPKVQLLAYARSGELLSKLHVEGFDDTAYQRQEAAAQEAYALWPEDTAREAEDACADEASPTRTFRHDPMSTALEFGDAVLGWDEAAGIEQQQSRYGSTIELRRSQSDVGKKADGPAVWVFTSEVVPGCWSVVSVSRPPDDRPTGVSISIRGRDVEVGFDDLGADSIYFEMGHGFHTSSADGEVPDGRITWVLTYKPDQTGHFLFLFRDENGEVFSASGGPLPAGDFAAG